MVHPDGVAVHVPQGNGVNRGVEVGGRGRPQDHLHAFAAGEGVVEVVRAAGAPDHDHQFLDLVRDDLQYLPVAVVQRLKPTDEEAAVAVRCHTPPSARGGISVRTAVHCRLRTLPYSLVRRRCSPPPSLPASVVVGCSTPAVATEAGREYPGGAYASARAAEPAFREFL